MKIFVYLLCHICLLSGSMVRGANAQDELKSVTIQLKWSHQFQFAGYYAALHKGFYREEGFEVVIKPGGPQVIVDDEVLSGRAEYGVLGSELIQMRTSGKPFVLLAVIMQHSPRAIIVRADSGINGPADLVGKHLMINRNEDAEFQAMFVAEGIDYEKLTIAPKDKTTDVKFIEGKIDGLNGSIGNQPFIFNKSNIAVKTIRPISYGIDFYGDSLFTSEAQIEKDIEQVEKIRGATIRGWYYALDNVEEIADLILAEYSPDTSREHLLFEAEAMRRLILPDLVDIGHVSLHRLERIAQIYADLDQIRPEYSLKGFMYDPAEDTTSIVRMVSILSIILAIASIVGATLLVFNARLKKLVTERTEELRSSNLLLKAVIEGTTDAVFLKNLEGRYLLANSAALQAIGKAESEVIGKDDSELFPVESARVIKEADLIVLESGQSQISEERLETSSGISYWLANKSPYRDPEGDIIGLIGISRNISDLKKNEEEKKALQKQLIQAQKMESIGTLAGGIAHDFNNILAAIMGYAEMVRDSSPAGSQAAEDLDQVLLAGERAKALVKQILTFSRLTDSKKLPIQPAVIIKETIKLLRSSIPATIAIKQEIAADSDFILADPTELHQIILNFCTNAFHAMEEKGGILAIALQSQTITEDELPSRYDVKPGKFVQLTIADTGSGIAPEILEKIFDPYFTTKEIGKGTGMGLSIAHGIVKSCDGFITCRSKPGEGTVFQVFFPVIADEISPVAQHADLIRFGSERILFVDDEEMIAEMGKNMLERLGYRVTARSDSSEALAVFRNQPDGFDLVITDQTMPGMTGSDLARRMLEIRPEMPIILCTGYSSLVSEEQARALGIKGFALKPLTKKDIAALIRKVLDEDRSLS
jgi:PAS domain S-box-containing protein